MNTLKTLYVFNKYYQGNQSLGKTSSWELTWEAFLRRTNSELLSVFNPDTFGIESHVQSDASLLKMIEDEKIEQIVMIYHRGIGWHRDFIGLDTLADIKLRNLRVVAIWGDIQIPEQRNSIKHISKYVDLNIMTASHSAFSRFGKKLNKFYAWVPIGREMEISSKCTCEAVISFAGSIKNGRQSFIQAIENSGINVHKGGGEGGCSLSRTDYFKLLAHPMSLSFAGSKIEPLINARTFEVISQGALLLEQWGRETPKFLVPFVDYVPWFNEGDLVNKVKYFTNHPEEAKRIAANGKVRFNELSDEKLWKVICGKYSISDDKVSNSFTRSRYWDDLNLSFLRNCSFRLADFFTRQMWSQPFFSLFFKISNLWRGLNAFINAVRRKIMKITN